MTSDEQAVRRTITGWLRSMKALDFTAGQQFWDRDFDGLVYQPEEHVVPVTGWEDLLRYWDGVPRSRGVGPGVGRDRHRGRRPG
jgi:hypothetical protein